LGPQKGWKKNLNEEYQSRAYAYGELKHRLSKRINGTREAGKKRKGKNIEKKNVGKKSENGRMIER